LWIALASRGIEADQPVTGRDIEDPLPRTVGPKRTAVAGQLPRRVAPPLSLIVAVHPQKLAGRGIERNAVAPRPRSQEQPTLDKQRRCFEHVFLVRAQRVGLESPDHLQIVKVLGIDLVERCIACIGGVFGEMAPFGVQRGVRRGRQRLHGAWHSQFP